MIGLVGSTVAAIATPAGGALGIVRVSGPGVETLARACLQPCPDPLRSHHMNFGSFVDPGSGERPERPERRGLSGSIRCCGA